MRKLTDEEVYVARVVGAVLALALVLILATAPQARAVGSILVLHDGATTIRLYDKPCMSIKMKPLIVPEKLKDLKAAEGDFEIAHGPNQFLVGCWRAFSAEQSGIGEPTYGLVWEDGDIFQLEQRRFAPEGL